MSNPFIRRALLSVSNKTGLLSFAKQLTAQGIQILATGGTADLLTKNHIPVTQVSDYTQFPEILGGRVKTLHPKIYAGILRRPDVDDETLTTHEIEPIDLVAVNLYPFQETIAHPDCSFAQAIEKIDIGGPAMLRAAAKNHAAVTVIADPKDYDAILTEIQQEGRTQLQTRRRLAQKAFAHCAQYDSAIAAYLENETPEADEAFPAVFKPIYQKKMDLRYGENPHQAAALYTESPPAPNTLASAQLLQGKPLSFNNLLDSDAALNCMRALDPAQPGCVIIKHATPCGVAQADTVASAYQKALATDPESAFGGIIAFNHRLDEETAQLVLNQFAEVILAPEITPGAVALLQSKPSWRVLACGPTPIAPLKPALLSISGGLLLQQRDHDTVTQRHWQVVTERAPTSEEITDLLFAWKVVQFVKSNAIVYAKNQATLGIGGGQTSRVFSAHIAVLKAQQFQHALAGAVAASDAFFPFADGLEVVAAAGIRAVIQPGGSKRDEEVIKAANRAGIAMVFTHVRHFKH